MSADQVEIDHVSKFFQRKKQDKPTDYETFCALQDVSFSVKEKEFLCVLGPSGCGKTTLIEMIGGLDKVDKGGIRIDGALVSGPNPKVAMVFQDVRLFPWRDVKSNVWFGLELRGVSKIEREKIANECIELVGLSEFKNSYPNQLSGGMQQRVGLARALANNPEILLMDEPFGSLDAQTRERLQDELLRILETERKTVIFVTHDIRESIYLGDRIVVLTERPGRVRKIVDVSVARPRWVGSRWKANLKDSPAFAGIEADIRKTLKGC